MSATLPPVDQLLWSWPSVCKAATNDWAKGFALSIARNAKRRNWKPSPKQHVLMNRMVADLYQARDGWDGLELIED